MIDKKSKLANYLPDEQKGLLKDGQKLIDWAKDKPNISDYSFLVFPFSKCYEGFLKKLFLDLGFIDQEFYYSDKIRIGKILNPHYAQEHPSNSVYKKLGAYLKNFTLPEKMWQIWKKYRNRVFHYFPANLQKLTYNQAKTAAKEILEVMTQAVNSLKKENYN